MNVVVHIMLLSRLTQTSTLNHKYRSTIMVILCPLWQRCLTSCHSTDVLSFHSIPLPPAMKDTWSAKDSNPCWHVHCMPNVSNYILWTNLKWKKEDEKKVSMRSSVFLQDEVMHKSKNKPLCPSYFSPNKPMMTAACVGTCQSEIQLKLNTNKTVTHVHK